MGAQDRTFQDEAFLVAQRLLLNDTAYAVAQLAGRFASGNSVLAKLVREQQDEMNRRIEAAALLRDNFTDHILPTDKSEEELQALLNQQDRALDEIERRLKAEFPEFNALAQSWRRRTCSRPTRGVCSVLRDRTLEQ